MNLPVALIATLDTKGPEVAYLRDRLADLDVPSVVIDTGILGEPVGITPDVSHSDLAQFGGITLEQLQHAGTRGDAVGLMRQFVIDYVSQLWAREEIAGGIAVGGVGVVMGAAALHTLPIGVPKIVIAPTASGRHEFGPYVGTTDVLVMHSVVDILGLNAIATTVFDNAAAAMAGMLQHGHVLPPPKSTSKCVGMTMLGNTTTAVGAAKDRLAELGYEGVVFHSSGVGGRSMEQLAEAGHLIGVIDYTTNEIVDHLTGGIHDAGPERLRRVGRAGVPQVVLPACVDFSVFASDAIPERHRDRPLYEHNPEYTLMRTSADEMAQVGAIFAERLNESTAPVRVIVPTEGLSIPSTPDGVFWDPDADARFLDSVRNDLRPDIEVETVPLHSNDPALGRLAADAFHALYTKEQQS
ncbi:Tm-1-like ATP-binding domain-containing protein [Microbacterium sp. NPDC076911]|uniref:Tm-1-like ATP-binding domain-containing protein n=1 Tax=Microbacterium sp. NPDC076911 TaxID=3154958 RepID=UPI00342340FB